MTPTQERRGRAVTPEEARQAFRRLVNSHFNQEPGARVSIPADSMDDDVLLGDYLIECASVRDVVERVKGSMEVIPWGERPASWDCYIKEFEKALTGDRQ